MLNVNLYFQKSHYINQYIYGFFMLRKLGLLKINKIIRDDAISKNLLRAEINGKKIVYDAEDGDHIERGFFSLEDYEWSNYYFKRSYTDKLAKLYPKCFPLGLNYNLSPSYGIIDHFSKNVRRLRGKGDIRHFDLETSPSISKTPKILFTTGLWDPKEFNDQIIQEEVEIINHTRLMVLNVLKENFSHCSTFGVNGNSEFTRKLAKDFILPESFTRRSNFIKNIKKYDICITSSGLHGSTGWRFGEYVSSSRSIISEPLNYKLPGDFSCTKNYLSFNDESSLILSINSLLKDDQTRYKMMLDNNQYYENKVRPDQLILRTLEIGCL